MLKLIDDLKSENTNLRREIKALNRALTEKDRTYGKFIKDVESQFKKQKNSSEKLLLRLQETIQNNKEKGDNEKMMTETLRVVQKIALQMDAQQKNYVKAQQATIVMGNELRNSSLSAPGEINSEKSASVTLKKICVSVFLTITIISVILLVWNMLQN